MYVYRSSRGDPKMYNFIDELKFKNGMRLKRNTTSNLFVGITYTKKECLLFIQNILMPKI